MDVDTLMQTAEDNQINSEEEPVYVCASKVVSKNYKLMEEDYVAYHWERPLLIVYSGRRDP